MRVNIVASGTGYADFLYLVPFGFGFNFVNKSSSDAKSIIWNVPEFESLNDLSDNMEYASFQSVQSGKYIGVGDQSFRSPSGSNYYNAIPSTDSVSVTILKSGPVVNNSVGIAMYSPRGSDLLVGGNLSASNNAFVWLVTESGISYPSEFSASIGLIQV